MRAEWIAALSAAAACFTGVIGVLSTIYRWNKSMNRIIEGQRCVLRSTMLSVYYKHREEETIRQYEYENFLRCYEAYKAMGGNSFISDIHEKVREWNVVS